jgi:hypothetical protein
MALEHEKCEAILTHMRGMDVQKKLDSINKAREMFGSTFSPEMGIAEFAYSAMIVEQFYNLIRDELRVGQIRIKRDTTEGATPSKESKPKATKAKTKTPQMDMGAMLAAFAQWKGNGPKEPNNG